MSGIAYACIAPHPPILVHEVGRGREHETHRTIEALQQVAQDMAAHRPETVLIFSPHGPVDARAVGILTSPIANATLARWDAPDVRFRYDNDLDAVALVREEAARAGLPLTAIEHWDDGMAAGLDWGCTVPLYYLRPGVGDAKLVPLAPSFLSPQKHYAMGEAIGRALERLGKRTVIICSADLSHSLAPSAPGGYDPTGLEFDEKFQQAIEDWDVSWVLEATLEFRRRAAEDAIPQMAMLMGALSHLRVRPRVLSYEGPFGVGYLVAAVDVLGPRSQAEKEGEPAAVAATSDPPVATHPLVQLAKAAVEHYVRSARPLPLTEIAPEMEGRTGVFVSIKKQGELRGCIGTIEPVRENVGLEIVHNAIAAAARDPRFPPIDEDELPDLTYSVDMLTPPEPVDGPESLDCKRYGVIVQRGVRRGLLLPDLEGVDSVEQQVEIAKMKAGILPDEPVELFRFEVQRFT
jgi:MEMO1 family protein